MEKSEAIDLLGGTRTSAAKAIGVKPQAISGWPDVLPPRIADRVQAALWRIANGIPHPEALDEPSEGERNAGQGVGDGSPVLQQA